MMSLWPAFLMFRKTIKHSSKKIFSLLSTVFLRMLRYLCRRQIVKELCISIRKVILVPKE